MKFLRSHFTGIISLVALAALTTLAAPANAQLVIPFIFDDTFDTEINSTIVGTGTFTFATDPGNGTFGLNDIGTYSFNFDVAGFNFTEANLNVDPNNILVVLTSPSAGVRRLQFSNNGNFAPITGGSLEALSSADPDLALGFEQSNFGQGLNLFAIQNTEPTIFVTGTYLGQTASAAPEPASLALLLPFALGVTARRKHNKK